MLKRHYLYTCCLLLIGLLNITIGSDIISQRLLAIAEKEKNIYKKIAENPEFYSNEDLDRRVNELIQSYRTYLREQPRDVSAYILYGKLLRRVQENEQAFQAFLKADEIDPKIAVVKQQIGNYLAEEGKSKAALSFYLQAVNLEPSVSIYHFSLGHLIYTYKDAFIEDGIFTRHALEREMISAFKKTAELEPENFDYQMRLGEAYYDLSSPDWKSALIHWNKLRRKAGTSIRKDILDLHRARVLGKLGRAEEAQSILEKVNTAALQKSKKQVKSEIIQH